MRNFLLLYLLWIAYWPCCMAQTSQEIPQNLIKYGIKSVGNLSMPDLLKDLDSLPKTEISPEAPSLALHKALMALGYNDENFEITTVLATELRLKQKFTTVRTPSANQEVTKTLIKQSPLAIPENENPASLHMKLGMAAAVAELLQMKKLSAGQLSYLQNAYQNILKAHFVVDSQEQARELVFSETGDKVTIPLAEWTAAFQGPQDSVAQSKQIRLLNETLSYFIPDNISDL